MNCNLAFGINSCGCRVCRHGALPKPRVVCRQFADTLCCSCVANCPPTTDRNCNAGRATRSSCWRSTYPGKDQFINSRQNAMLVYHIIPHNTGFRLRKSDLTNIRWMGNFNIVSTFNRCVNLLFFWASAGNICVGSVLRTSFQKWVADSWKA